MINVFHRLILLTGLRYIVVGFLRLIATLLVIAAIGVVLTSCGTEEEGEEDADVPAEVTTSTPPEEFDAVPLPPQLEQAPLAPDEVLPPEDQEPSIPEQYQ